MSYTTVFIHDVENIVVCYIRYKIFFKLIKSILDKRFNQTLISNSTELKSALCQI